MAFRDYSNLLTLMVVLLLWPGDTLRESQAQSRLSPQQSVPADTLITLRRPDCFLTCPDYLVTIAADGTVTFEGYANVRVKGTVRSQISREKVQMLVTAFLKAKYFSMRDEYFWQKDGCTDVAPNSSSALTSIRLNGKFKAVNHYHGCRRGEMTPYPKALTRLEEMIDEVANTTQWID